MKRGIVLSIEKKKAVVMTADGQFISIPQQSHMRIGEETAIPAETAGPAPRKPKRVYWYTGVAAAAAILLFFIPFFYLTKAEAHPVVAYLSLDINPSIELGVDKQQLVQELKGLNSDGQVIVSKLSYKGKPLEAVAASIMSTVAAEHYLDKPDKDIVITSLMVDDQNLADDLEKMVTAAIDQKIKETIKQIDATKEPNVTVLSVPSEVREEAAANGISSGKMAVYLMAKDEGFEIELEQMKVQSIAEATQAAGGVKKIVEQGASKEKLKELAQKEKKSGKQATIAPAADKASGSKTNIVTGKNENKTDPVKPTETPTKHPTKPTQTERPGWSKDQNNKWNKPNRPVKPISPTKPSGSDKNKWPNGDWSNNRSNPNDKSNGNKKGNTNKDKVGNSSNKLENWSWQDYNRNSRNDRNDKKRNESDNRHDRNR
jgi:hypothetical protein